MVKCPKCNAPMDNITVLSEISKGHECEALCFCQNCFSGFEYWKMWIEEKRVYIEDYRIIKY